MVPTGDFLKLQFDILQRYRDVDIPITFGVLIADFNQSIAREYILNYLELFNTRSGKLIDFFLPGYETNREVARFIEDAQQTAYYGGTLYFSRTMFLNFISQFEDAFNVKYTYTPMLILAEHCNNDARLTKKIIIDLNDEESGVKKSGLLFDNIFSIAKEHVAIEDFESELTLRYLKGSLSDTIINAIDNSILTQVHERRTGMKRYRIC